MQTIISTTTIEPKSLSFMADEFKVTPKTFSNHIKKDEVLKNEIKGGVQFPRHQKMIYERFGYPQCVNKKDYEHV
jgi:hypothetical protein